MSGDQGTPGDGAPPWPQAPSEFTRSDDLTEAAERTLGPAGRMIAWSKHAYRDAHPENEPVFNANVCLRGAGKIWYGDLDLTLDGDRLQALADLCGEAVYVLYERAARFDHERVPDYRDPAGVYTPRR